MKIRTIQLATLVTVFSAFGTVLAGSLDPPGPPAPTMISLQQIYDKIGASCAVVPKTGQTGCWDASGTPIACAGTGQDGEYQKGAVATPRFTNNGDGTAKDNLTGLIWLRDTSCFAQTSWANALSSANTLASGACGLSDGSVAGNWRLPNINELQSLLDHGHYGVALPLGSPFCCIQAGSYWSSTSYQGNPIYAWASQLFTGDSTFVSKANSNYLWPVRGGN